MPLFDPNSPSSEEPAALYRCRSLLSNCAAAIELLEAANPTAALALIVPGPADQPSNGQAFTVNELEDRISYLQLFPNPDDGSLVVSRSRAVGCVSEKEGIFRLHARRMAREAEYNADNGRWDLYFYFLDLTSRICEELVEAADLNLAVSAVHRVAGPLFNHRDDWPTQGTFLFADFLIHWGGSERAE